MTIAVKLLELTMTFNVLDFEFASQFIGQKIQKGLLFLQWKDFGKIKEMEADLVIIGDKAKKYGNGIHLPRI